MATKLFVGCLPYSKTEAELLPVFAQFGDVQEVAVLQNKGAAFVTFTNASEAAQAVTHLQGHVFEGSTRGINVSYATKGGGGGTAAAAGKGPRPTRFSQQPPHAGGPTPSMNPYAFQAAQTGRPGSQVAPGAKLFVGQLPYSKSEKDLWQLFSSIGPVVEVALLKDPQTKEKKGAAFVSYQTAQHAATAVAALDGFVFNGATRPITVSIAAGGTMFNTMSSMGTPSTQAKRSFGAMNGGASIVTEDGAKLFVGQLPFSKSERDLQDLFSPFGKVAEVVLQRDGNGQKKGAAFVRFFSANSAAQALECDGYLFPGSTRAISVNLAGAGGGKRQRFE